MALVWQPVSGKQYIGCTSIYGNLSVPAGCQWGWIKSVTVAGKSLSVQMLQHKIKIYSFSFFCFLFLDFVGFTKAPLTHAVHPCSATLPPWIFREIFTSNFPPQVLWMKAVRLQGQVCKGLWPPDQRRFHMERANQSQDSTDNVFESAIRLKKCWVLNTFQAHWQSD